MSTRVKVAVAVVIAGALVILIALDGGSKNSGQTSQQDETFGSIFPPREDDSPKPEAGSGTRPTGYTPPNLSEPREEEDPYVRNDLISGEKARDRSIDFFQNVNPLNEAIKGGNSVEESPDNNKDNIKGDTPEPVSTPAAPQNMEYYTIRPGDSLYKIAQTKLGDGNHWKKIQDANPGLKEFPLRIGKKIRIPEKATVTIKQVETADAVVEVSSDNVYTVKPGDTLSGISQRVFKTVRYTNEIFQANRDKLRSAHDLYVGMKLNLPGKKSSAVTKRPSIPVPPAGARLHTVSPGESLWKIAERYANGSGILGMMDRIVAANPERLPSKEAVLRVGWKIVIPE